MGNRYDAVVVGAGPAGSVTARMLAESGASVLLVDRRRTIGEPVRCGELMRRESLAAFVDPVGPWTTRTVDVYRIILPDGFPVEFREPGIGVLLDRRVFDKHLADQACAAGAELKTGMAVVDLVTDAGRPSGVVTEVDGVIERFSTDLVIAADGVASRVARMAGRPNTSLPLSGLATSVSAVIETHDSCADGCELHFGREVAPGGYLWVFPRLDGAVNVGVGVSPHLAKGRSARVFLEMYTARRWPGCVMRHMTAGGIPITAPVEHFSWPGLILVGDAARQVNPLTGAGIYSAMSAGRMAGAASVRLLATASLEEARAVYDVEWQRQYGDFHRRSRDARAVLDHAPDDALNAAGRKMRPSRAQGSVAQALMDLAAAVGSSDCTPSLEKG